MADGDPSHNCRSELTFGGVHIQNLQEYPPPSTSGNTQSV